MNIGQFQLVNEEKVQRAIYGSVGKGGAMTGGVGENAGDAVVIAEYDRLGGLVLKEGEKVKTGSFYDFQAKVPRETPDVVLLYTVNGRIVEVPDGAPLPVSVRAAQMVAAESEQGDTEYVDDPKPVKGKRKARSDT